MQFKLPDMRKAIPAILAFIVSVSLSAQPDLRRLAESSSINNPVIPGAWRTEEYFPLLKAKHVGVVANQTSLIREVHLVDSLLSAGITVVKVFTPEHGFRGNAEAGASIGNDWDSRSGLPLISLYGDRKKPGKAELEGLDIVIFDLQDVGARFYTYISTMTYMMEACAENNIPLILLDRPNPNGFYVDGPVLKPEFSSFVGLHPVPVVHGMTMTEYARMVNGERWLKNGAECNLTWVPCKGYTHKSRYRLPVRPSPNLPDMASVYLYPSLCFFEGTVVSVGRGTKSPFTVIGHPDFTYGSHVFRPVQIKGVSENPPHKGVDCYGYNLRERSDEIYENGGLRLEWLVEMYKALGSKPGFFNNFFDKLAGTDELRRQIQAGVSEIKIRESWETGLQKFKEIRNKYLLYPDFE
jgi:uncharacterized protein YbbC (DUF1343 family)